MSRPDDPDDDDDTPRADRSAFLKHSLDMAMSAYQRPNRVLSRGHNNQLCDVQMMVWDIVDILKKSRLGLGQQGIGIQPGFDNPIFHSDQKFSDAITRLIEKHMPLEQMALLKVRFEETSIGEVFREAIMYGYLAEALGHVELADQLVVTRLGEIPYHKMKEHFNRNCPPDDFICTAQELAQTLHEQQPDLLQPAIALGKAAKRLSREAPRHP